MLSLPGKRENRENSPREKRISKAGGQRAAGTPQAIPDSEPAASLAARYAAVRKLTLDFAAPLSEADASAQSMADASPAKWHLAHTTWFFETFLLRDHLPGYELYDERWPYLFNSYYEAEGERVARPERGLLTRPSLAEVIAYRAHVDAAMGEAMPRLAETCAGLVELGLNHEQQHQELLLTDILHLFSRNPLGPAMWAAAGNREPREAAEPLRWLPGPTGIVETGYRGEGFAFDCEGPAHRSFLAPYELASRPVSNGEWAAFIEDGGYREPTLWLSDGWDWVRRESVSTPLYWQGEAGEWRHFTLSGWQDLDPAAPVCHISFYEADAHARWAGARLPTEEEWEAIAKSADPAGGNQLDRAGPAQPRAEGAADGFASLIGNVWEWTGSAYRPYPGFHPAAGAVGEYNGKFMSGQFVLKGGSCATPRGHVRASYRNFFYPHQRWQFTGLRLARAGSR
jgi:ergothioneine biosynthesis protein EgtB